MGFLLGGVGEINKNRHPNFMVVDKSKYCIHTNCSGDCVVGDNQCFFNSLKTTYKTLWQHSHYHENLRSLFIVYWPW